jgi:hypothetical protein
MSSISPGLHCRQVAILCNHQKTVSKAAETMFENLNEKLATLKEQRRELEQWKALAEKKKSAQVTYIQITQLSLYEGTDSIFSLSSKRPIFVSQIGLCIETHT